MLVGRCQNFAAWTPTPRVLCKLLCKLPIVLYVLGMTSEGGASVAYPVMTLAFSIKPSVARDFSFMIQSCGMTAAAFTILFMVSIGIYLMIRISQLARS